MFKSGFGLTVGVRNLQIVLPLANEKGLAMHFRCYLAKMLNVAMLHCEDEVCLVQDVPVDLASAVGRKLQPVVLQYFMSGLVHGATY